MCCINTAMNSKVTLKVLLSRHATLLFTLWDVCFLKVKDGKPFLLL